MKLKFMFMFFLWWKLLAEVLGFQGKWKCLFSGKIIHSVLPCIVQCCWYEEPWRGDVASGSSGNSYRSRQPKVVASHSREMPGKAGICWILESVGDKWQESASCRDKICPGWMSAKVFWHIACRVSQMSEHHSWSSLPFAEARLPSGADAVLPILSQQHPKCLLCLELRKNCDLALKVARFSCPVQLNSHGKEKAGEG